MTNALLKVFPIILLVVVVAFLPKVTCLRLQVDPQKYVGDGLHPSAFSKKFLILISMIVPTNIWDIRFINSKLENSITNPPFFI